MIPTTKTLHIVSLNIPYPADYGGVIDIFHKIRALHAAGVKIILHAFAYGRENAEELNRYCEQVYYYPRKTGIGAQFSMLPYIVNSRKAPALLANLLNDDHPILFEGLHTCYYLGHPQLRNRIKIVRAHNIEHIYYRGLAKSARRIFDKVFFAIESCRLKRYEKILTHADYILPLSQEETPYFASAYPDVKTVFVPIFHPGEEVNILEKAEEPYLIYHGDLSISKNVNAANYLIDRIALQDHSIRLVIAGRNPDPLLERKINWIRNVTLMANPDDKKMSELIRKASINILYMEHGGGVKLKLLHSLYNGRFCMANDAIVEGSMLDELCIPIPKKKEDMLRTVHQYYTKDFGKEEIEKRRKLLTEFYDNGRNASLIVGLLEG